MKKLIIAVSLLVLWAGTATAAGKDKKDNNQQLNEQSLLASTPAMNNAVSLLLDENSRLRTEAEILQKKVDDLSNRLDYSQMMYTSIATLKNVVDQEEAEELNSKMGYMHMMHVTLMNLSKLLVENK
jgi:uncharacterized protein YlxW (UPF0749 family)